MTSPKSTTWIVESFENGLAVLKNHDGTIKVSRDLLSEGVKRGEVVTAEFFALSTVSQRKRGLAKAILEEIIGSE